VIIPTQAKTEENMKLTVKIPMVVTADVPAGSKLLMTNGEWVTWYANPKKGPLKVSTCHQEDFECQNDTQSIELSVGEIRALAKIVGR